MTRRCMSGARCGAQRWSSATRPVLKSPRPNRFGAGARRDLSRAGDCHVPPLHPPRGPSSPGHNTHSLTLKGDNMHLRRSPLHATIVTAEQALPVKPFGLDMKVLLTTEATGGAISVLMGWHKPGEGPPDHVHFD